MPPTRWDAKQTQPHHRNCAQHSTLVSSHTSATLTPAALPPTPLCGSIRVSDGGSVFRPFTCTVLAPFRRTVLCAVRGSVFGPFRSTVCGAVVETVCRPFRSTVVEAVCGAVCSSDRSAVRCPVRSPFRRAVLKAIRSTVFRAFRGAVLKAIHGTVFRTFRSAVLDASVVATTFSTDDATFYATYEHLSVKRWC